jgi:hypothetical protein
MTPDQPDSLLRISIIEEITEAFGGVRLKNGITLHQARAIDDWKSTEIQRAVRANDTEARWQEITDEKLRDFHDVLSFLDYEGVRFYLPAFMCWVLRHLDDEDSGYNYSTIRQLARFRPDASTTEKQGRAVCRLLRYLARYRQYARGMTEALAGGWGAYCTEELMS